MVSDNPTSLEERRVIVEEEDQKLKREQFEYERSKGVLSNVAVLVTTIAGLSAIAFQFGGYFTASQQLEIARKQAEAAASNEQAAKAQAQKDWNFRGTELFVHDEDKILVCDPKSVESQVSLFSSLFPDISSRLADVASAKANTCAEENAVAAATSARARNESVQQAVDNARYTTIAAYSAVSAPISAPAHSTSVSTVYIQIADEAQRPSATILQKALRSYGYSVPGVQLVAAAPRQYQVRYYYAAEKSAAHELGGQIAKDINIPDPVSLLVPGHYKNLPTGTVEFWFPSIGNSQ